MADLSIKRGATLQLLIALADDNGAPLDVASVITSSQVRDDAGKLIDTLEMIPTAVAGQLKVAQATADWPLGNLLLDFKIIQGAVILKSETIAIEVERPITT